MWLLKSPILWCVVTYERDNNPGVAIQRMKESYLDEGNKQGYEFSSLLACNSKP